MSNTSKSFEIADSFKEKIKEHGFTFCGVFDPEGKEPNFVYSINATPQFGAEFIALGNISLNGLMGILNAVLSLDHHKEGELTIPGLNANVNGEPQTLKLALVDVSKEEWLDQTILNRCDEYDKVYQLVFGDLENQLPTSPGNEDSFKQFHFRPQPKIT